MYHRIIYSLQFELEPLPNAKAGQSTALIVPLCRDGNSTGRNGRPRPPKRRTIDLRAGDQLLCMGRWRRIIGIEAYRAMVLTNEQAATACDPCGYLYSVAERGEVYAGR